MGQVRLGLEAAAWDCTSTTGRRARRLALDCGEVRSLAPAESEWDALFEALRAMWGLAKDYPDVWPVASVEEFPALLQRVGVGG